MCRPPATSCISRRLEAVTNRIRNEFRPANDMDTQMNSHFHRSGASVGPTVSPGRRAARGVGRRPEPILKLISQRFIALNFPSDCSFCFRKMAAVKIVWFSNFARWKSAIVVYRL